MAKKKKKNAAKRSVRKPKKKLKTAKKRAAGRTQGARKAKRAAEKKTAVSKIPTTAKSVVSPQAPARSLKPQSSRQDSLRESMPDDLEMDDDLVDEVPAAMREELDDEESLDENGRGDYLDKPDELGEDDE